jgi:hypothetical protein
MGPAETAAAAATYADNLGWKDPKRDGYWAAGWVLGDVSMYRDAAKACKGDVKTLREAAKAKKFEGSINDDGSLTYGGFTIHWKDAEP